jgi:hypothetical protein
VDEEIENKLYFIDLGESQTVEDYFYTELSKEYKRSTSKKLGIKYLKI